MADDNGRVAELEAELAATRRHADRLCAALLLVLHDAHPVYSSTAGWQGGIGGQMMTPSCSIISPPPDARWAEWDLPSEPARDWLHHGNPELGWRLDEVKDELRREWLERHPSASAKPRQVDPSE